MVDLHVHSTFSDGSLSPEELADEGARIGLYAMALTDHDSTRGTARFLAAAKARGIKALPGLEISVEVPDQSVHILGYGIDPDNAALNEKIDEIRNGRKRRNNEILSKLSTLGYPLTFAEVAKYAGDKDLIGRPHIARALIEKGFVRSKAVAFEQLLGKGGAAYSERFRYEPRVAIEAIRNAGGVAVLAHPSRIRFTPGELDTFVGELVGDGLAGIEVFYPGHSPEMIAGYIEIVNKYGLLMTGGSDFHGTMSPNIALGTACGGLRVGDNLFDALCERLERR